MLKPEMILLLSDARGVFIPRDFANEIRTDCLSGVNDSDMEILKAGPEHEWYWEAWDSVSQCARVTDPTSGVCYSVHLDGDCWLIPEGMEWNEESDSFAWPEESTE